MVGHAEIQRASETAGRDEAALVVVHGPYLGRMYRIRGGPLTVGSDGASDIRLESEGVLARHATVIRDADGVVLIDEQNATRVNDEPISEVRLGYGDVIRMGRAALLFLSGTELQQKYEEELHRLSKLDTLTLAFNRRSFDDVLVHEFERSQREDRPVSLLMIGLDGLAHHNEAHGRIVGDELLRGVAALVRNTIFGSIVARHESDVFSVMLPYARLEQAVEEAEALRTVVAQKYPLTVSVGAVTWDGVMDRRTLLDAGMARLKAAKASGRDRVSTLP